MIKKDLERQKAFAVKVALIIWLIIILVFILELIKGTQSLNDNVMAVKFIQTVNILLGSTSVATSYISYKKIDDSTIFIVMLILLCLSVSIVFGFVDYKFFYAISFNGKNYLFLSILPLKLFLMWAIIFKGRFYDIINFNKTKSVIIVVISTIMLGYLDESLGGIIKVDMGNYYIISGIILSLVYIISGFVLILDSIKKRKIIYMFLGGSLFILGIKCFYLIYIVDYALFNMKLIAVFLTYIAFFIVVVGVGVELYTLNEENISLNNDLTKFYNLVENNKNSNIFICDEDINISYMNKRLREEVTSGENAFEFRKYLLHRKLSNLSNTDLHNSLKENGAWGGIIHNKDKNKVYECSTQVIDEDNGSVKYLVSYTDISKAIKLENEIREMKINSSKEAIFISNLSHELKTPLNIFSSSIQLLDAYKDRDDFKDVYIKYSYALRVNTKRMLRLINNIVDTTKINLDELTPDFKNYEIVSLVEDIVLSTINYGKTKEIYIEFDTEVEEHYIKCDAYMIEKILLNLISNGIKYSNNDSLLNVNLYFNDEFVEIHVKDNGVGIKEEDIDDIYDRFSRCDNSLQRMSEGSGIGLSLVKALVNSLGGQIEVVSRVNVGSTFKVKLPNTILEGEPLQFHKFNGSSTELELSDIY